MQKLQQDFFEEFKRLDAICRDMLGAERGVSAYIEQMEETPAALWARVPGWKDDYYALKHLRWVRNKIAHETGFDGCTPDDLQSLAGFTRRVLTQQDPLALLRRQGKAAPRKKAGRARAEPAGATRFQNGRAAPAGRRKEPHPVRTRLCAAALLALFVFLLVYLCLPVQ